MASVAPKDMHPNSHRSPARESSASSPCLLTLCPPQALKEEGRTKEAERAFFKALALDLPDAPSVHALRIMAQMKQQRGEHAASIKVLDKVIGYNKEEQVHGRVGV